MKLKITYVLLPAFLALILISFAGCAKQTLKSDSASGLRFIGDVNISTNTTYKRTALGGLSGIAFNPVTKKLLAISDDKGVYNPSRFYHFDVIISSKDFKVIPSEVIFLKNKSNDFFPVYHMDSEGIVLLGNNHLLLSTEGFEQGTSSVPPSLVEFKPNGQIVKEWPVPDKFIPGRSGGSLKGIRHNLGFEGLAITPDKQVVFTANEGPLQQDGKDITAVNSGMVRLIKYKNFKEGFRPVAEYAYEVSAVPNPQGQKKIKGDNGLVELLALDENTLLALERSYVKTLKKNFVKIFRIKISDKTTDVSSITGLKGATFTPVSKELLLDLETIVTLLDPKFKRLDNIEGMCFGPRPENGNQTLILVSDNNFNPKQRTLFLAFEIVP